ncbi:MAG: hypothetical protein JNJ59_05925 [Deltaproteobacteria bacterium]|nr:hypothetical protein [Deltaproteobacteria bacterium]
MRGWVWGLCGALAVASAACGGDDTSGGGDLGDTNTSGDGDVAGAAPTVVITAPEAGLVAPAGSTVTLAATVGRASGGLDTLEVEWTSDRVTAPLARVVADASGRTSASTQTLPAGAHVLTATVIAPDGQRATASVSITIDALPSAAVVHIEPREPKTTDDLAVVIDTAASDPDGAVTLSYRWLVDGVDAQVRTANVPAAKTARGQTWKVEVVAEDEVGNAATTTAEVVIGNSAPTCGQALVLPSGGTTSTTFTCRCSDRADADGDDAADTCTFKDGDDVLATGGCTLDPSRTTRGMGVTCLLVPSDGDAQGEAVTSAVVAVMNAAPSAPAVTLAPVVAGAVDAGSELECQVTTLGVDPDGDPVTHALGWTVDGVAAEISGSPAAAARVMAGALVIDVGGTPTSARRGSVVRCSAQASDGTDTSRLVESAPLTLGNAAPLVDNVLVQPLDAGGLAAGHGARCVAGIATDPDGDALTLTRTWLIDEVEVQGETGETLAGELLHRGQVVRCLIRATDGIATTEPAQSKNQLTVKNTPPAIATVTLGPAAPKRSDTLTCGWSGWSDADGDPAAVTFAWAVTAPGQAEQTLAGQTGATLAIPAVGGLVPVGASVRCVVTPNDGLENGPAVASAPVTLGNTTPTLASAALTPANPNVASTLTCAPVGFSDPDGDAPVYTFAWSKNAAPIAAATEATLAGAFQKGDHLRCVATPGDGVATGAPVTSNEVVIGNSAPSVAAPTLIPAQGSLCQTYTCTPGVLSDPDPADVLSVRYRWEKNGVALAGQSAATVVGATVGLAAGDVLRCFTAPWDGTVDGVGQPVYGEEKPSGAATADNGAPSLSGASITPASAGVGATLTCTANGWQDDCTAEASVSWVWLVDGATVQGANSATFATNTLALGTSVRCRATPNDGARTGQTVDSNVVTLGPGEAVAPVVEVRAPDGAAGTATCAIVTAEQWFTSPTYTWYWSINGVESVGTQTLGAAQISDCDLVACRVVVQDARSSKSSAPASLQLAVGPDCEDGNDCTSHVCKPGGGCAVPVPETGIACVHEDLCKPLGTCQAGVCMATGSVCTEEPLAAYIYGAPKAFAWGDAGYGVAWPAQELRATDEHESRMNEATFADQPTRTTVVPSAYSQPVGMGDGSIFAMTMSGCVRAGHPNNSDGCTLYGSVIDPAGAVTTLPTTVGYSSNQGCGGLAAPSMKALDLGGRRASLYASNYRYYWSGAGSGCKGTNSGVELMVYDGAGAGVAKSLVASTAVGLDYWNVLNVAFDGVTAPPGSDTFVLVWVPATASTLESQRFTWSGGTLTSSPKVTVTSGGGAIGGPRVASFFDGSFIVGWSEGSRAWGQRFDSDGQKIGAKFRLNDFQTGVQTLGGLATFTDFGFVAVWDDSVADGTGNYGIRAQRFDASGLPEGPAQNLNTFATGAQTEPSVAALSNDQWVVTWQDQNLGMLMTRRFERDGAAAAGVRELLAAEVTTGDQSRPKAATSTQGTTLVVWDSPLYVGQDTEIAGRLYQRSALGDGRPVGAELQVNVEAASTQRGAVVAGGNDRFVVAWESLNEDGSSYGIVARIFDAQARPVTAPFIVNTARSGAQTKPAVAIAADGTVLVAWQTFVSANDTGDVMAKAYDKNGVVLVGDTVIPLTTARAQEKPVITLMGAGFLVGWESNNQVVDGGYDLFARTVTLTGAPGGQSFTLGTERQLNATTAGNQRNLALGVSPNNYVAACWETPDAGGALDVLCQTFAAATFIVKTAEFNPAALSAGQQEGVQLAYDSSGRLVVAWESEGADTAGRAVMARWMSNQGPASGPRVVLNRTQSADQSRVFVSPMTQGDVWFGWQSAGQDGSGASVVVRLLPSP